MVTLLNISVSGFAARFGVTTASSVVKPSLLFVSALQNATPAGPVFEPMMRSMCAISLPSPTRDSPRKKSAIESRSFERCEVAAGSSGDPYTASAAERLEKHRPAASYRARLATGTEPFEVLHQRGRDIDGGRVLQAAPSRDAVDLE